MTNVLRQRKQRRVTQPQQAAAIDWGNPITRSLSLAVNLGAGQHGFDAVTGARNTVTGTKGSKGPVGGLGFGATVGAATTDIVTTPLTTSSVQRTYLAFVNVRGSGGSNLGRIIDRQNAAAVMSLYYDVGAGYMTFQHTYATSMTQAKVGTPPTLGRPFCIAVSFDGSTGSNVPVSYVDGRISVVTALTSGTGAMVSNSDPVTIGNRKSDSLRNLDGDIYLTLVWDRILSPAELSEITLNPWQVFRANSVGVPFGVSPVTGTIAVTLGGLTVAITASDPDSSSFGLTLGSFTMAAAGAVGITGTVAATLGSLTVTLTAADPDASSIGVTLGSLSLSAAGSVSVTGSVATTLSPFAIDIEASDPDSSSFGLVLGSFTATGVGAVDVTSSVASTLSPLVVDIEASDPDSSSFGLVLGSFTMAAAVTLSAAGSAVLTLSPFVVDIEASDPDSSSFGMMLDSVTAIVQAGSSVDGSIAVTLNGLVLEIEVLSGGGAGISLHPDDFLMDAEVGVDIEGNIASALDSFVIDIEVTTGDPIDDAVISIQLDSFEFYAEANTDPVLEEDMTLSELIPALLNTLVDNRVWQDATPDDLPRSDTTGAILPFIVWTLAGGQDSEYVEQFPAPSHNHFRLTIHACSPSGIAVDRLIKRTSNALLGAPYTIGVYGSPVGTYDGPRKLRGRRQQFSLWFRQS